MLEWNNLIATVTNIILQDERDTFVWHFLKNNDSFNVNPMYMNFINNGLKVYREIWPLTIPLKIIFSLVFQEIGCFQ